MAVRAAVRVLPVPAVTLLKFKAGALEVSWPAGILLPDKAIVKLGFEAFETIPILPLVLTSPDFSY